MTELTNLSLFSGIGGLDLAAEMAGFKTVAQCEYADFPTKVLEKHWKDVERWRDIHDLRADEFFRRTGFKQGQLTCISGGFPCQPHSLAGKRRASGDERDLWSEYRRVVSEIKPRWVVAENVRGLLSSESGRFFRGILRDFANLGYDVGWCCYRAADVGAIHPRERVAIIAHTSSERMLVEQSKEYPTKRNEARYGTNRPTKTYSNIDSISLETSDKKQIQRKSTLQEQQSSRKIEEWTRLANIFEPKLLRSPHGIPDYVDRIKGLGNAVVPQQFYPIYKAIAEVERQQKRRKKIE